MTGAAVRPGTAAEIFAAAGARVDGARVRIPAELVERWRALRLRSDPRAFELPGETKASLDAILADVEVLHPGA